MSSFLIFAIPQRLISCFFHSRSLAFSVGFNSGNRLSSEPQPGLDASHSYTVDIVGVQLGSPAPLAVCLGLADIGMICLSPVMSFKCMCTYQAVCFFLTDRLTDFLPSFRSAFLPSLQIPSSSLSHLSTSLASVRGLHQTPFLSLGAFLVGVNMNSDWASLESGCAVFSFRAYFKGFLRVDLNVYSGSQRRKGTFPKEWRDQPGPKSILAPPSGLSVASFKLRDSCLTLILYLLGAFSTLALSALV